MDGFRDRLNGRYDRSSSRKDRYERAERPSEDRYDRADRQADDRYDRQTDDRYDRGVRRQAESISVEAVSDAIDKSNRNQLEIIADLFDEAKADRLESERAIIGSVTDLLEDMTATLTTASANKAEEKEAVAQEIPAAVDNEILTRIENIVVQDSEAITENGEMLERSYNSLRGNTELLNDLKNCISDIQLAQEDIKNQTQYISQTVAQNAVNSAQEVHDDYGSNSSMEKEEIIGAIGDNRALLNMIRQDIISGFSQARVDEIAETGAQDEAQSNVLTSEDADRYFSNLEEHVHKECVKCYRNVESKLEEQNLETIKKIEKKLSSLSIGTVLAIVSLVFNIITLGLLVCYIFNLI